MTDPSTVAQTQMLNLSRDANGCLCLLQSYNGGDLHPARADLHSCMCLVQPSSMRKVTSQFGCWHLHDEHLAAICCLTVCYTACIPICSLASLPEPRCKVPVQQAQLGMLIDHNVVVPDYSMHDCCDGPGVRHSRSLRSPAGCVAAWSSHDSACG
jgi:hypothetical protein